MRKPFIRDDKLFVEVIEQLSKSTNITETIPDILASTCSYFRFGCAFIYEADHRRVFLLKEAYSFYEEANLPPQLHVEKLFSPDELSEIIRQPVVYARGEEHNGALATKISRILNVNALLLVPVLDAEEGAVGLVGLADHREKIALQENDRNIARSLLDVVANHIKLRIYQRKLENAQKFLGDTMNNSGVDIYVNDFETHEILYLNESMAAPYGSPKDLIGQKCWEALYLDKDGECSYCPKRFLLDEAGEPTKTYSWDYQRPFDGAWFRVLCGAFPWIDGRIAIVVSSIDITESKRNELLIERMAYQDSLTRLKNRHSFETDVQAHVKMASGTGRSCHVLYIDLDKFKSINDVYGHAAGDQLLKAVGEFLLADPRMAGHAYRLGGDEFALLLGDLSADDLARIMDELNQRFQLPWLLDDLELPCGASIGKASYPDDGEDFDSLVSAADRAMYQEKKGKAS